MNIIKRIIFHILLALRGIVLSVSKFFALLFLATGILMLAISDMEQIPLLIKLAMLAIGITFTLINWFYDDLIFYFEPEGMNLRLYR